MKQNQMYVVELNNAIYEIKNLIERFNSRLNRKEYKIIN